MQELRELSLYDLRYICIIITIFKLWQINKIKYTWIPEYGMIAGKIWWLIDKSIRIKYELMLLSQKIFMGFI